MRARVQGNQQINENIMKDVGLKNYRASSKELEIQSRGQSSYKDLGYQRHYIENKQIP